MRLPFLALAVGLLAAESTAIAATTDAGQAAEAASAPASAPPTPPASASAPVSAILPPPPPTSTSALAPSPPPSPAPSASFGLLVLALSGATDAAWPLAEALYATPSLRPTAVDDAGARVLAGEAVLPSAPQPMRDLAESVAAIHGDDAPSRAVLDSIARRFAVRGIVVVRVQGGGEPTARIYLPATGAFDAAAYAPDAGSSHDTWSAAVGSLVRTYGASPPPGQVGPPLPPHAPALATHAEPPAPVRPQARQFWQSGWFWGAIGAAAFGAGAAYFITRDNTGSTIHLEAQVPH